MNTERPEEVVEEALEDAQTEVSEPEPEGAEADVDAVAALAEVQAKADENWERYLRALAEVENVRKRAGRDVENAHKFAGSNATLKLLGSTLERFGIVEVDPAGEPFDPEFHEAISMQPSDDVEPGSVVAVVQKGYTLNGRLLRPAMVIVAAE
jgi:molecular chaperone GrpE